MVLAEKSQEEQLETLHTTATSTFHNNTDTVTELRAAAAAAAALGMSFRVRLLHRRQLPRPNEALDRIQNKELFIIIYTKLVH